MPRRLVFLVLVLLSLCPVLAQASSVYLGWTASPDTVTGYKLHVGTVSGTYPTVIDVGLALTATVASLLPGTRYFFAATAYNADGSSPFSNEVSYLVPVPVPGAPSALRIILTIDVAPPTP